MNMFKTVLLMTVLTAGLVLIGGWVGGQGGAVTALVVAGAMNFASYFFSDRIVLRMYRARVTRAEAPEFYEIMGLARRAGLPVPRVAIILANSRMHSPPDAIRSTRSWRRRRHPADPRSRRDRRRHGARARACATSRHADLECGRYAGGRDHGAVAVRLFFGGDDRGGGGGDGPRCCDPGAYLGDDRAGGDQPLAGVRRRCRAEISGKPRALASALQKLKPPHDALPRKSGDRSHVHRAPVPRRRGRKVVQRIRPRRNAWSGCWRCAASVSGPSAGRLLCGEILCTSR